MYPLNTNLVMEIAASKVVARRNEWPDDPDRMPRPMAELPQDPLFIAATSARKRIARWIGAFLTHAPAAVEPMPIPATHILPVGERTTASPPDCANAA